MIQINETVIKLLFYLWLISVPAMIILFGYHLKSYKRLLELLEKRGKSVDGLERSLFNYGSSGCMNKIKVIQNKFANELLEKEKRLISKSKFYYYLAAIVIVPFLLGISILIFQGIFNK